MDDLVGGLVEGAVKFLAGLVMVIAVPVLAVYFAIKGVVWLFSNYWHYMAGAVALLLALLIVVALIKAWADHYAAGASKRRAMRQLNAAFKASSLRMEDIARLHSAGNPSKSIVPVTPGK